MPPTHIQTMTETMSYTCNGLCEECSLQRNPYTHAREYDGTQSDIKRRDTVKENPMQIDIPLTDSGNIKLSEF